ncbi:citrate lyase subunit beta [Angomonas deanei]|uniref:HpcH/HpaI aldolase/citrate lyase family, putative n=1 Tax=Angomonas deanei TaxID=59799 RepID=S9VTV8_9TRYP|nr:citrate lyase subunit beta [Angomonas deanei]EPY43319.1 citrate lyase subunit beta [Angomonas deanei]CAD2219843.1 HpcH/HpaI aldolase/citrate lyase family, putative [Angomonas deanei]|eukprot:EPY26640.1 citrate lyase subunit beta [Angomonas deanei]
MLTSARLLNRRVGLLSTTPLCRQAGEGGFFASFQRKYREFELERDRALDKAEEEELKEREGAIYGEDELSPSGSPKLVREDPRQCPRSVLFVPGVKPKALSKIYTLHADCFILDLEDSVGPAHKKEARDQVLKFVLEYHQKRKENQCDYKRIIVRINSPDDDTKNALFDLNLVGELGKYIEGVAVPKVRVSTYELIKDYIHPEHAVWGFFESPRSVIEANEIFKQKAYQCAVMGYNDLAAELQLPLTTTVQGSGGELYQNLSPAELESLRVVSRLPLWNSASQVLLAARAHGVYCLDGVFNHPTDHVGFQRDLRHCLALGFNGKTLIHPSQISPTNRAYTPSAETVAWATQVQEAVSRSQGTVAVVNGSMIEELHVRQAKRILALHRSGALDAELQQKEETEAASNPRPPRSTPSRQGLKSTS